MIQEGLQVWSEDITTEERDRALARIAEGIVRRGMVAPAILFLEMHKPLTFFASQSLIVLSPIVAPIVGLQNCVLASRLLEDRANVERLIVQIETANGTRKR